MNIFARLLKWFFPPRTVRVSLRKVTYREAETFLKAGWQLAVTLGHIPPVILPSPVSITKYIIERYDILLMHAVPTTLESAASFVLATLLGQVELELQLEKVIGALCA